MGKDVARYTHIKLILRFGCYLSKHKLDKKDSFRGVKTLMQVFPEET